MKRKYIALILVAIALLLSGFLVIKRLSTKEVAENVNNNINNANINPATNKPLNLNINSEKTNINTNTAPPNTNHSFEGTPPEITKGNINKKQIIFTFDAGSGNQSAQKILEILKKHSLKGTFFLTGQWVKNNEDLTKQIASAGHEIFNHTFTHPYLTQISDAEMVDELKKTDDLIFELTGRHTQPYFRPPYGERNAHILEVAAKEGYQSVFWTTDALDWKESEGMTAQAVKDRITSHLSSGAIFLMHVGDNITGQILDEMINKINNEGYVIVPLSQGVI